MSEFNLEGQEYIELNKLMKILNLVASGGEANAVIDEGMVKVNGAVEKRRRNKLRAGDTIEFLKQKVTVRS